MTQEWAIQDEATGEWWNGGRYLTGKESWGDAKEAMLYNAYADCFHADAFDTYYLHNRCATARIVPAPPREMTDEECWKWLAGQHGVSGVYLWDSSPEAWACASVGCGEECPSPAGIGSTPCDAIRAARRVLEKGSK